MNEAEPVILTEQIAGAQIKNWLQSGRIEQFGLRTSNLSRWYTRRNHLRRGCLKKLDGRGPRGERQRSACQVIFCEWVAPVRQKVGDRLDMSSHSSVVQRSVTNLILGIYGCPF
mmetsp:Transcript_13755/g.31907  ORF Transcript_13755/g.31907 Transcript_13755/m.31907 type:complete len:114 (+) Transcript_13755:909-1250(+)